jgi:hypothetical protein
MGDKGQGDVSKVARIHINNNLGLQESKTHKRLGGTHGSQGLLVKAGLFQQPGCRCLG